MVPSLLQRLGAAKPGDISPVAMLGQNSVRDFIDMRDVVSAYLAILDLNVPRDRTFNACTGRETRVGDVVQTVLDFLGQRRPIQFLDRPNSTNDIPYLVGDPLGFPTPLVGGPPTPLAIVSVP